MNESVLLMLKYGGISLGLLFLVYLIAVITPKLAALVDKQADKIKSEKPERVEDNSFPDVKGIYDAQLPEETDKNNENGDADNG